MTHLETGILGVEMMKGVALSIAALGDKTSQGRWPSKDDHGKYPIKSVQIQSMAEEIARLAIAWDWKKSDIKLGESLYSRRNC